MKNINKPQIKTCPKCGNKFECKRSEDCWCNDYKISEENLKSMREKYNDCLCPECLRVYLFSIK
ncbi:MAG: cysteine-rich CWC family protein [Bacteroidales bacterium]|nr:cysteine-rich CWC family protein [Bacteroidales bacterium]